MSQIKEKTEYEKRCLSILDCLDKISNKENLGLNYDPRAILKSSNLNYDKNKYAEKETKSFDFSDKFFSFPKDLGDENSEEEQDSNEQAMEKCLKTKKESEAKSQRKKEEKVDEDNEDFERPVFNEKVKENIIRNSEEKLFKKEKIDYDLYNKVDFDFSNNNNEDVEMESDKYAIFKRYKNENLFFNEMYSKDNIMDICDMIGKEIEQGNDPTSKVNESVKYGNKNDVDEMHIENSNQLKISSNAEDNEMQIDSATARFKKAPKRSQGKKIHE